MSEAASAYVVVRRSDGFGDVFPLMAGERYNLGRASTNRIVLKDELCSREHAELCQANGRWRLRDLNSLNGLQVNGSQVDKEADLKPGDEIHLGRTFLVFVEEIAQLPHTPTITPPLTHPSLAIKKRLSETRLSSALTKEMAVETETPEKVALSQRHSLNRDLGLLYRLALEMGSAGSYPELTRIVLERLLEAIPAEVGAILSIKEGRQLELSAYHHRDPRVQTYYKVSEFVSNEVLSTREAILAEDVAGDQHLKNRDSITDIGATSLICAPIEFGGKLQGLIHLYSTDLKNPLDAEDLEFAVAVAKQLGWAIHQTQRQASLTEENKSLRHQLRVESELVGTSQSIREVESQIGRVAGTNATVLIRGESGTGKELVARAIHFSSPRRESSFVCLNCAALTETLLESELFGHEKGAFTGATEKKIGKFEAANHGTIFLDEIGEMNHGTQAKFLRVLEGHQFERVGGNAPIKVDVRVVAATNQPLEQFIQEGKFRRDLFYRLQVIEMHVPPLRERQSDVPLLAEHFLKRFIAETGRKITGYTATALKKMEQYHWPGNVRELRNVVERAVALGTGPLIDAQDIWLSSLEAGQPVVQAAAEAPYKPMPIEDVEKDHILRTLNYTTWNKSQAATILQIERSTLDRKIKGYDIKR